MGLKFFFADFELISSIFCMIATVCLILGRSVIRKRYSALAALQGAVAVMLFFDSFAWFYRGVPGYFAYGIVLVSNFVSFAATALLQVFFVYYAIISAQAGGIDDKILYVVSLISWTNVGLVVISQFTGFVYSIDRATNLYQRGPGFALISVLAVINNIVAMTYLVLRRNRLGRFRYYALLCFIILPTLAAIVQVFIYGYSLSNLACFVSSLIMFAQVIYDNARTLIGQEIHINQQNNQLQDMRTRIALSQIRPEFLYETLNSVYDLCETKPELAKELIVHLENYLRENIESIDTDSLIPFGRELEHTRVFLEIVKFKYGDKFDVEYNIDTTGFELPALTVQPIVENAVTHGISTLEDGRKGLIRISTERGNGYVKVMVTDNGKGFDMNEYKNADPDDKSQIGIRNVKERLKVMEDAELHVKSQPGEGTEVDIIIPTR